ncbi:WhiB family transcriptional regulator [Streptomyces sp. NPDC126514]|uniref:WhiB family transcriptional regulator n=1 Tax=Streptomyces sp. NPDC126514 TaxID=3155210 RepID=UPI0033276522
MSTAIDPAPFPAPVTPTACRRNPQLFDFDYGDGANPAAADRVRQVKAACRACPVAETCLRWALAHPQLTPTNVWAATTPRERSALRKNIADRRRLTLPWTHSTREQEPAR